MPELTPPHPRPIDATLTVTRAAGVLGVHPNTIRAWSDAGRLRYYRINPRGDRRYRMGDLQRFLAGAAEGPAADAAPTPLATRNARLSAARRGTTFTRIGPSGGPLLPRGMLAPGPTASRTLDREIGAVLAVMSGLERLTASAAGSVADPDALFGSAARIIRDGAGLRHVSLWRRTAEILTPVGIAGATGLRLRGMAPTGILGAALADPGQVIEDAGEIGISGLPSPEVACAVVNGADAWGVLLAVADGTRGPAAGTRSLLKAAAEAVGLMIATADRSGEFDRRIHRAEALSRVAGDIGSRLDLDQILSGLVDHALVLLGGDRASVLVYQPDGTRRAAASRGLSASYLAAIAPATSRSLVASARETGAPVFAMGFRDDPRAAEIRAAVVQEGFDTLCLAPLFDGPDREPLGSLNVYHDRPHAWSADELDTMQTLAAQASVAIRTARNYAQLENWAAQLQSIQQLGTQLSRLSTVEQIGAAIASELRQLIDYHNVRVYRLDGDDLIPVAMKGQVGEYIDETPDQLRVKVGSGITGWVAEHRVGQVLHDAAADPRANTIPGTEPDLDESMLLAPMLYEDRVVGVLVLSKLGLHQFRDDDLRLLGIYATFAAQAMNNAAATERLQRQIRGQRDLLTITESILTTLDVNSVLESVVDRLGDLVGCDNVAIELVDTANRILVPVVAKGVNAASYLEPWLPGETGLATWVVDHNEPVLLRDQYDDPRVHPLNNKPVHGGLICAPLRGRAGAIGILTIERLGEGRTFSDDEFELVKLFAAQVSIAVQNAQAHGAIAREAETDDLTGLDNHRSFRRELATRVEAGGPFSLLMIDLDHFKLVNDTFGHEAGNDFLQRVSVAIVGASRDTDAVFRYGGDEFAVLLSGADAAHVGPTADRIRRAIAAVTGTTGGIGSTGVRVDASAGIATFPTDGVTANAILLAADRACFVAKRSGGGRVASAHEGEALAGEFTLKVPTPIDVGS